MTDRQKNRTRIGNPVSVLGRFLRDFRGAGAVEFAFIAPVLLSLYLVTLEVAQGIETNKKVGRVGSMVADLVTQQQTTTKNELDAIMEIGGSILQPYNRSSPKIIVTGIEITDDDTPEVRVVWSRKLEDGAFAEAATPGTTTSVPPKLEIAGSFLVRVESFLEYEPVITYTASQKETLGLAAAFDGISMRETYYLRPRMSPTVACTDC